MASTEDINRYSLPVETLIRELVANANPDINTAPGSAINDMLISPASLIFQHFRDYSRVVYRNQSLSNYPAMLPEELDRVAANYMVTRHQGTKASGTVRVTFSAPVSVTIPTSARFVANNGQQFQPTAAVTITDVAMGAARLLTTGEYYVDVPVEAVSAGSDGGIQAGAIARATGIPNYLRAFNEKDFTAGSDIEGNSELFARITRSITNRDLVKASGIEATILDNFPTVRRAQVIGFGDPLMERDRVDINLSDQRLFTQSFAQKVNLPLDAEGNVTYLAEDGGASVVPLGGTVGAIVDLVGRDFSGIEVSVDGVKVERVSVQPNNRVRMLGSEDPDAGEDFIVTRVEEVPIVPNGPAVRVIRLDRPFKDTTSVDPAVNLTTFPYTVYGFFSSTNFHVGGCVDVYVDPKDLQTSTVLVSALPALSTTQLDVAEIPITTTFTDAGDNELFETGGFSTPVLFIEKIERVSTADADEVLAELVPDVNYSVVSASQRGEFTAADNDVIVVRGTDSDGLPLFTGTRLKVTYKHAPEINQVQEFLDSAERRDVTKNVLVRTPQVMQVNLDLSYTGNRTAEEVRAFVSEFIRSKTFGSVLTVQEIITVLSYIGITDIELPVRLRGMLNRPNGTVFFTESDDRLTLQGNQVFYPQATLNITKNG